MALVIVIASTAVLMVGGASASTAQPPSPLFLPLALRGTGVPLATVAATVSAPTPTPTLVFSPGTPALVYGNCNVVEEQHVGGDATVTARWTRAYNYASRVTHTSGDFASGHADGIVDRISVMTYRNGWMPLYGVVTDTLQNVALVHEWHSYNRDGQHVAVLRDEDGDGKVDSRTTYTYDSAGRTASVLAPGRRTDFSYNGLGLLERVLVDFPIGGSPERAELYHWQSGLMTQMEMDLLVDGEVEYRFRYEYNDRGWLVRAEDLPGEWRFDYSQQGWLTRSTLLRDGELEIDARYSYDAHGRLTRVEQRSHASGYEFTEYFYSCQ